MPAWTTTWYTSASSAPATFPARNDSATATRPSARSEDVRTAGAEAAGGPSAAGASAAAGVSAETSPRGSPARSAQAARSAFSSTAPASGGSRNVPDSDPSSSNRQTSRRRTRASASSAWVTWRCARANRSSWFAVIGPGQLGQPRLGRRGGDPGQRPDLGVRQPRRGEPGPDDRQVPQRAGHPDVLPGRAGRHLALPRQPLRAGAHLPAGPAAAGVEVGEQDQEPARRRGQVPGQLADLRLHPLQRHPGRLSRRRRGVGWRRDSSEDRA